MSCESFGWSMIFTGVLLALTIWSIDDYKFCALQFGYIRVAFVVVCVVGKLATDIPRRFPMSIVLLLIISLVGLIAWDVTALVFYITNLIETESCVTLGSHIVDGIFVGMMTILVLWLFWVWGSDVYRKCKKKKADALFEKELHKIYSKIHNNASEVEEFIERWEVEIDRTPLTKKEEAIIRDKFCAPFNPDKEYSPEQCCICYDEFEGDKILLDYPNCNHSYHFDCINEWLQTKMQCPMCKGPIRVSILRAFVNEDVQRNMPLVTPNIESSLENNQLAGVYDRIEVEVREEGLLLPADFKTSVEN